MAYLNFRRVVVIQNILYNKELTEDQINHHRGQLYELDQMLLMPKNVKDMVEFQKRGIAIQDGRKSDKAN